MLGGIKVGTRRIVVVTGASSGLGLWSAKALADRGDYFVVCAVRNPKKMDEVAKEIGLKKNDYIAMQLELGSLQSVKDFVSNLRAFIPARPLNHLICNAAVYRGGPGARLDRRRLRDVGRREPPRPLPAGAAAAPRAQARQGRARVRRRLHHRQLQHHRRRFRLPARGHRRARRPQGAIPTARRWSTARASTARRRTRTRRRST